MFWNKNEADVTVIVVFFRRNEISDFQPDAEEILASSKIGF